MTCVLSQQAIQGGLVFEDATPSTPLSIALVLFGDWNLTEGRVEPIWTKNHQGLPSGGPPHRGASGLTVLSVTNAQIDSIGDDATNLKLPDFLSEVSGSKQDDLVTTNTSTGAAAATHTFKTFKVYLTMSLDGGTTTKKWQINNCIVTANTLNGPNGGLLTYNFTITSDQPLIEVGAA